jgi:hypothetical protein
MPRIAVASPVCPRCLDLIPGTPGGDPDHPHPGPFADDMCVVCCQSVAKDSMIRVSIPESCEEMNEVGTKEIIDVKTFPFGHEHTRALRRQRAEWERFMCANATNRDLAAAHMRTAIEYERFDK